MRGDRVGAKIQDRATGARFWPMKRGSIYFQAEVTPSWWGIPCFRPWGPAIGRGAKGWLVGAIKPKTESLGLGFGKQNMGGASVLGRGDLGRARNARLKERVGVVL